MIRRLMFLGVATTIAAVLPVTPAPAAPHGQSTSCNATLGTLFDPGLDIFPSAQSVRARGNLMDCVGGGVTSGTVRAALSGTASCTSGSISGRAKVTWDTTQTSVASVTVDIATGDLTGTVTSGLFAGEPVTGNLTLEPVAGDCLFTPVTRAKATGPVSL